MAGLLHLDHVVLIPTKDRPHRFAQTLRSVLEQASRHPNGLDHVKVVVLDTSAESLARNRSIVKKIASQGLEVHHYTYENAEPILSALEERGHPIRSFVDRTAGFRGFRNLLTLLGHVHTRTGHELVTWLDDDTPIGRLYTVRQFGRWKLFPMEQNYFEEMEKIFKKPRKHEVVISGGHLHGAGDTSFNHLQARQISDILFGLELWKEGKVRAEDRNYALKRLLRKNLDLLGKGMIGLNSYRTHWPPEDSEKAFAAGVWDPDHVRVPPQAPNKTHVVKLLEIPYAARTGREDYEWLKQVRSKYPEGEVRHDLDIPHIAGRPVSGWNISPKQAQWVVRKLKQIRKRYGAFIGRHPEGRDILPRFGRAIDFFSRTKFQALPKNVKKLPVEQWPKILQDAKKLVEEKKIELRPAA